MSNPKEQNKLKSVTSIPKWRERAPWTYKVDLIFLVGAPRSGTTWLQAMLASHPKIYTGTETLFFMTFQAVEQRFWHPPGGRRIGLGEYLSPEEFYNFMADFFWRVVSGLPEPPREIKYFLEKTNSHCLYADFILRVFPKARFIHLVRDARAVVASMLRAATTWGRDWAPRTVDEGVKLWARHVEAGRLISQKVRNRNQFIQIKYEDIRKNPSKYLKMLFEWLNLPVKENLITTIIQSNSLESVRASKNPFVSIPLRETKGAPAKINTAYPGGFIGPAPYKLREVQLSRLQRLRIEYLVGDILRGLGYPEVKTWFSIWEKILISSRIRRILRLPRL